MTTLLLRPELIESGLGCPPGKAKIEFCDTKTTGLRVEVSATGKATYFFSQKLDGRRTHHRLGSTDEITLDQARAMALAIRARTQSGQPPTERKAPSAITVGEFFAKHYLPFVRPRKRSWKRDEELYRLRIEPAFGHKRLDELTRQ
jgi:hypothetical protein